MCRAGGRRCEYNWSSARREQVNARRRALYATRKAGQSFTTASTATVNIGGTSTETHSGLSLQEFRDTYSQHLAEERDVDVEVSYSLMSSAGDSGLACSPMSHHDRNFDEESSNDVRRVILEDGTVGYWKGFAANDYADMPEAYGHEILATLNNEVAAYKLSEALGDNYYHLVPETVFRELGGDIGSFQREVSGPTFSAWVREDRDRRAVWAGKDYSFRTEHTRAAAIFDYLSGSQDRHGGNIVVEDRDGQSTPALIDNGFSFSESESFLLGSCVMNEGAEEGERKFLTSKEREPLQELYDSPDSKGLKNFLTPEAYRNFRDRLALLLQENSILELSRHDQY